MAKENLAEKEVRNQEKLQDTVSKTEQFFNDNKNIFYGIIAAVLVIGFGVLAYTQWILKPKQAEAMEQMYPAEASFASQAFEVALNGDGNNLGFKDIIDQYGAKAGKATYMYAGVCELQLGHFEEAISYLKKYNGKDKILAARAISCIGDAYVGLEDYNTAVSYFEKAAAKSSDIFSAAYLLKAGIAYEALGQKDKALNCYNTIKDQYPQSVEGYDIDKYISRLQSESQE